MPLTRIAFEDRSQTAERLRAARDATAVLLDATTGLRQADDAFLRRLDGLSVPTVAIVGGSCDASALAVLAGVSLGFVTDDVTVSVDAATILALGLTSSLPAAVGGAHARALLLGGGPIDAEALRATGLARPGDAEQAARRLAEDPAAGLLLRSMRVAARSTAEQARHYDTELRRIG
jgi:enoyl-CoA hydratase/carnithine racemase